jgi:hypothetical protein
MSALIFACQARGVNQTLASRLVAGAGQWQVGRKSNFLNLPNLLMFWGRG